MELRDYQREFVTKCAEAFKEHKRILGVAATGAGKTIIAAEIMATTPGRCLFLADARELIIQNADKYHQYTGEFAGVEQGSNHAFLTDRVVVATSQTIHRRLDKYPRNHFDLLIIDEAHRNTLGGMSMDIINHFGDEAKVLGVTATPFRSDRKNLGDVYETIAVEVGLDRLIREGWLSRIIIKSVPLKVDLSAVRMTGGDYRASDVDDALDPHLFEAAELLKKNMEGRRAAVTFLPLVKTSKRFAEICNSIGLPAVHVDGEDREALRLFTAGKARVICNASLLTTGWDCPFVDLVYVLRPTKSLALYMQMIGRGTRRAANKENLLLLDPLYLADDHRLIRPARLFAADEREAESIQTAIDTMEEGGGIPDLLDAGATAQEIREANLRAELEKKAQRKARTVDAMEFAFAVGDPELMDYEPEMSQEQGPASPKQLEALEKFGFDVASIKSRGQASRVLDLIFIRRDRGLASPKQLRLLKRFAHPSPELVTFEAASAFIDEKIGGGTNKPTFSAREMIALRRAGHNPLSLTRDQADTILAAA
jgi:superfamily II DNA or RNA helicase